MSKRLKTTILLIVMLTVIVGSISGCSKTEEVNQLQEEEKYTPVEIQKASISTMENKISINGKVTANEEITVIPKAVGIVTSVNVSLGDTVQEGSVLFTIEQQDVLKSVDQAANGIELAKKGVAQAENAVKSATINYELNKEKIQNAKLNLERMKELYEEGAISKSQLEQAELAASDKNLDALMGQISQAEISYQQALNQLTQAEISYEQASSGLSNTVVKAPMSGIISSLNVKEGQIATNSQAAATIVDMNQVYVQINVVESIVNKLQVGQDVEVNIPAAFNEYITSTISYISPTADPRSQLYPIKVYIDNADKNIRPGMNGEVKLGTDKVDSAIVIKGSAVLDRDGQKIVYVVEDNKAVEKIVTVGMDTGDYIEIKEGIKEGDSVIVEGQHYVENGEVVKVVRGE